MKQLGWWAMIALAGCGWRPGTLDVHLLQSGGVAVLPVVASHVDLRTDEGVWIRLGVEGSRSAPSEGSWVLTRGMVPPGRYTAVRVGYYVAVPRPDLQAEPVEGEAPRVPVDILARSSWASAPFCVARGGDLRLTVAVDPLGGGRSPAFRVEEVPGC